MQIPYVLSPFGGLLHRLSGVRKGTFLGVIREVQKNI